MTITIREARPEDAEILAGLEARATEGMSPVLWARAAAPGQDPWELGRAMIEGTDGMTSHRNARVAERRGRVLGAVFAHGPELGRAPVPEDCPSLFRPVIGLVAQAPGAGYIDLIATCPGAEGQGVGARLLERAEAEFAGPGGICLVVSDANAGARRFYARHGYADTATAPKLTEEWDTEGDRWILMVKR